MTNAELNEYYTNLLIFQYKTKEKAPLHISALIDIIMVFELIEDIQNGFNVETAIGAQQDIIGKYLGIDRTINGIPFTTDYWGFMLYGNDPNLALYEPFMEYGDTPPAVEFFKYGDSEDVLELTDTEFRRILKFRIIQANSYHSLKMVDDALFEFFGTTINAIDNEDMTVTYDFPVSEQKTALILQSEDLLPRPMGVELIITFS
jgi:hypothetical protein